MFPSFEWFPKGFRWLHAHRADGMPNATAFTAVDRYLLLLDAEGQNPRRKADGMPNATAFIAADRYLLLLDAEGQNPRHKADGMPNATAFIAADHSLIGHPSDR